MATDKLDSTQAVLEKAKRGEKLTKDEQTLWEDLQQAIAFDNYTMSPTGHFWRISGAPAPRPPDVQDAAYGPHERHRLDLWKAESNKPTPLLICLYGGGFRAGDKSTSKFALRPYCLDTGISVAAINYRHSQDAIAPASMYDGARAIQFLRYKSKEWNLDPTRFAGLGNSAGAGIILWCSFRDDMANPKSKDPIEHESTRLSCTITYSGQCSYDPRFIKRHIQGPAYKHPAVLDLFGITEDQVDNPPPHKAKLMEESAAINFVTADDPPAYMIFGPIENKPSTPNTSSGDGIHHPSFGNALKAKMDALGIECYVRCKGDDVKNFPPEMEFLKRHLRM
jgi:acetyl esterase